MCLMSFGDNKIIIFNSAQLCHDEMVIWSLNNVSAAVGVGGIFFFFLKGTRQESEQHFWQNIIEN